jgi:hypothetical protein
MTNISRLTSIIAGPLLLGGCISTATAVSDTRRLISADPIQTEFTATVSGEAQPVTLSPTVPPGLGKEYLGLVLIDSGSKCQAFADRLSTAQRGVDTSFDILTGILSALATALTPLSTVHALTAGATISTGTKSAIAADVYAKATASLILQQINNTYYVDIDAYRKELLQRDVNTIVPSLEVSTIQEIHRKCSLDSAIATLSQAGTVTAAALGALSGAVEGAKTAGAKGLSSDAGAIAGAAAGAAAGASGATAAAPEAAANKGAAAAQAVGSTPVGTVPPSSTPLPPSQTNIPSGSGAALPPPTSSSPRQTNPPSGGRVAQVKQPLPLVPLSIGLAQSNDERALARSSGQRIQLALCMAPDSPEAQAGDFGPQTREAIQSWRSVKMSAPAPGPLTAREILELLAIKGTCDRARYQSYFELKSFPSEASVQALQKALGVPSSDRLDDATRAAIKKLQRANGQPETGIVTRQLVDLMSQ